MQTDDGWTGFHALIKKSPESILKLLGLVTMPGGESILTNIATALTMQTDDGWTAFSFLTQHCPESIPKLLELATKNESLQNALDLLQQTTIIDSNIKFKQ